MKNILTWKTMIPKLNQKQIPLVFEKKETLAHAKLDRRIFLHQLDLKFVPTPQNICFYISGAKAAELVAEEVLPVWCFLIFPIRVPSCQLT